MVGGYQNFLVQLLSGQLRCRGAQAACSIRGMRGARRDGLKGYFHTFLGSGPLQAPHFSFFPWLALPSSSEQRPVRLLPFGSATFPSSLLRSSDDLLLRSFFVGPVLRPGLNSIHCTQSDDTFRRSSLSATPAIRSTRRFFRLQRHVVVFSFFPSDSGTVCFDGDWCWGWWVGTKNFLVQLLSGHLR